MSIDMFFQKEENPTSMSLDTCSREVSDLVVSVTARRRSEIRWERVLVSPAT